MMKLVSLLITILILGCVSEKKKEFKYKELLEDSVDTLFTKDIKGFYDVWTIREIASCGGSFVSETEIQSQIGKKLVIEESQITFELYGEDKIENPTYEVKVADVDSTDVRGTSWFWGYRPCRENLINLVAHGQEYSLYFEVIHFQEIVYYHDGRLFFLRRD